MNEVTRILIAAIPTIIVALLGAGGFWSYLEYKDKARREDRIKKWNNMSTTLSEISSDIKSNAAAVEKLENQVKELYAGQMVCATKISKIDNIEDKFGNIETLIKEVKNGANLSIAYARDRLNYLSNIYMKLGYIPQDEVVAYKLLGQAYIDAGGNSETRTKFDYCVNTLPTRDIPRKMIVTNPEVLIDKK